MGQTKTNLMEHSFNFGVGVVRTWLYLLFHGSLSSLHFFYSLAIQLARNKYRNGSRGHLLEIEDRTNFA